MKFDQIFRRLNPFVLQERYYNYTFPEKKSLQMYDFYVLDYLRYLVENMSPQNFRDLPMDLEDSVKDSVNKLFPTLRQELLNAVFYAVCAEMRHSDGSNGGNKSHRQLFTSGTKEAKIYNAYLKYMLYHKSDFTQKQELVDIHGVEKPRTRAQIPDTEIDNDEVRNISYKAARYAIKKTGLSEKDFMEMCLEIFTEGRWSSSYGGHAWGSIAKGWLMLNDADQINPPPARKGAEDRAKKPMSVAIDHVYDLQHNTDTVFNKLKSYYGDGGYGWIGNVLDHKANTHSYFDLLSHCSSMVKNMAQPILYNRLGSTWENDIKNTSPDDNIDMSEYNWVPIHAVDGPINGKFVVATDNLSSYGFTRNKVYKVLNHKSDQLLLRNDENKIKKVYGTYFNLLVKRSDKVEKPTPEELTPKELTPPKESSETMKIQHSKIWPGVKTGDMLEVITGDDVSLYDGDIVEYIMDNKDDPDYITILLKGNKSDGWAKERFKPIKKSEPRKEKTDTKFRKGDMVECVDDSGWGRGVLTKGKLYEVIYYDKEPNPKFDTIQFMGDDGYITAAYTSRFKLPNVKKSSTGNPFKVGDKVKLKPDESYPLMTQGKIYTIADLPVDNDPKQLTALINDEGKITVIYYSRLEPIWDDPSKKLTGGFAVGSKVKLKDTENYPSITKGKVYTVIDKNKEGYDPSVITYVIGDHGYPMGLYTYRFEQVKDRPTQIDAIAKTKEMARPRFKINDHVEYTSVWSNKIYTGTIKSFTQDGEMANIEWDDGTSNSIMSLEDLKKINPSERDIKI